MWLWQVWLLNVGKNSVLYCDKKGKTPGVYVVSQLQKTNITFL